MLTKENRLNNALDFNFDMHLEALVTTKSMDEFNTHNLQLNILVDQIRKDYGVEIAKEYWNIYVATYETYTGRKI
jgi:hypothetical protein